MVAPDFRNGEPQPYPHIAGGDTSRYLILQSFVTFCSGHDVLYGYCIHLGLGICFAINISDRQVLQQDWLLQDYMHKAGDQNLQLATMGIDAPL